MIVEMYPLFPLFSFAIINVELSPRFYIEAIADLQPTRLCEPPYAFLSKPTSKWWVFEETYVVKIPFHRIFVCFFIAIPFHVETTEYQSFS